MLLSARSMIWAHAWKNSRTSDSKVDPNLSCESGITACFTSWTSNRAASICTTWAIDAKFTSGPNNSSAPCFSSDGSTLPPQGGLTPISTSNPPTDSLPACVRRFALVNIGHQRLCRFVPLTAYCNPHECRSKSRGRYHSQQSDLPRDNGRLLALTIAGSQLA